MKRSHASLEPSIRMRERSKQSRARTDSAGARPAVAATGIACAIKATESLRWGKNRWCALGRGRERRSGGWVTRAGFFLARRGGFVEKANGQEGSVDRAQAAAPPSMYRERGSHEG